MSELLLKYDDDDVNDNDDLKHFNKYNNFRVIWSSTTQILKRL
jgi:hypothetical protein